VVTPVRALACILAVITLGALHAGCTDLSRPDDPTNYRPSCTYEPTAVSGTAPLIINDFESSNPSQAPEQGCFNQGSTCLSQNGATSCDPIRPNRFGQVIGPFCDGDPAGKICIRYMTDTTDATTASYLSLAYDTLGSDPKAFAGYVEKLGDQGTGWFNLRALNFRLLTFRARATSGALNAEIALKSAGGQQTEPKLLLSDVQQESIGGGWMRVSIPIADLARNGTANDCVDLSRLSEVNLAFARVRTQIDQCGVVDIDDIAFEQ
jgi:hypothetical protein